MTDNINDFVERLFNDAKRTKNGIPVKADVYYFADSLMCLLFPHYNKKTYTDSREINAEITLLKVHLKKTLTQLYQEKPDKIRSVCSIFFEKLPCLYDSLLLDADAIDNGDPAAESLDEVIITYPGFFAIAIYRFAHEFYELKVPIFPRLLTEYAHRLTGIDIHPGAKIGKSFFIDHGTGIVIGESTIIGNNVKLYQGVTLGALSVDKKKAKTKRHPTVEDNVIIYSGATILGGNTTIGNNSVIGGNSWIIESVPPNSVVYSKNEIEVKTSESLSMINKTIVPNKLNKTANK